MQVCQCRKKRQFEMHTMCFFYTSQAGMEKKGMTAQQQHRPLRQQQQQHHPSQHEVDITLVASPTRHSHQARSSPSVSPVRAAANSVPILQPILPQRNARDDVQLIACAA